MTVVLVLLVVDATSAKTEPRGLTIHAKEEYIAFHHRRQTQNTSEFLKTYNQRGRCIIMGWLGLIGRLGQRACPHVLETGGMIDLYFL